MSFVKFNGKASIVSTMAFALVTVLYSLTKKEPTDRIKVSRESLHGGEDVHYFGITVLQMNDVTILKEAVDNMKNYADRSRSIKVEYNLLDLLLK